MVKEKGTEAVIRTAALRDSKNNRAVRLRVVAEEEAVAADGSSDSSPNRSHNSDKCLGSRHLSRCSDSRLRNRSIECPRDRPENRSAFTNSRHRSRFGDSRRRSKFGVNSSRRVIECLRARPKSRSDSHTIFRRPFTKIPDAATAVVGRSEQM